MALRSVVEIDVEDSKFREFQRNFDQYHEKLKDSSTPWADVAKGTSDAAEALDTMVKKERDALAVAKLTAFAKGRALEIDKEEAAAKAKADYAALSRMEKLGKGAKDYATRMAGTITHWKSVTGQAKETEARVANVTKLLSGWKALSLLGGLGGIGGTLYGLDRLAAGAAAGRRQSMGTGVPYGKQRAFSLDYSRFTDGDALMGSIGTAKGDATSQQYLGLRAAGISGDEIRRKDAADLGAELFDKLPGLFPRGANDPTFGSSFEARGLGSLLSQEDAKRYLNASPEERQAQRKAYEADSRSMAADPASLRSWADLDGALGRAKDNIETALVRGLAPLAPQFTTLSGNIATLITDFAKSPEIKSDLDSLATGLGTLDKALKDPDSWWNRAGRAVDRFSKAEQQWGHDTHDWLHKHAPWATWDHYSGADNPYTGKNVDLNRAHLRGRSAVDEPEDRKRRAGDKLRAFGGHPAVNGTIGGDGHGAALRDRARGRMGSSDGYTPGGAVPGASGRGLKNAYWTGDLGSAGEGGKLSPAAQFAYLKSIGATDNEATLLTGAASSESSFNPNAVHDPAYPGGPPTGHGLFGHKDTRLDMRGKNWQQQDQAALAELRRMQLRDGTRLSDMLAKAKTPAEIADVEMHYEGPAGYKSYNPRAGDNYMGRLHSIERFQKAFVDGKIGGPAAAGTMGTPPATKAITDAEVFAARQRIINGSHDPKDRALVDRYLKEQNTPPTVRSRPDDAWAQEDRQHIANLKLALATRQHRAFPWQHHSFAADVQRARSEAGIARAREEGRHAEMRKAARAAAGPALKDKQSVADAMEPSIFHKMHDLLYDMSGNGGLGLHKMQRPGGPGRIEVANATGSNIHVSAFGSAFG